MFKTPSMEIGLALMSTHTSSARSDATTTLLATPQLDDRSVIISWLHGSRWEFAEQFIHGFFKLLGIFVRLIRKLFVRQAPPYKMLG